MVKILYIRMRLVKKSAFFVNISRGEKMVENHTFSTNVNDPWGLPLLKGQCHEIFCFWFFSWISFPPASVYEDRLEFFRKFAVVIRKSRCTTGFNDTGGKFATGINDTSGYRKDKNKLPEEGYWKNFHNYRIKEKLYFGFLQKKVIKIVKTISAHTKSTGLIFRTIKKYLLSL